MFGWRRPHRLTLSVAGQYALAVGVFTGASVLLGNLYAEGGVYELVFMGQPMLLMVLALWRDGLVGVFVSGKGVRVRTFGTTQTIPWSSVARIDAGPEGHQRLGGRLPAIWVVLIDGRRVETPLMQGTILFEPLALPGRMRRVFLNTKTFNATLQALRGAQMQSVARAAQPFLDE
jgi:hypothetical protein